MVPALLPALLRPLMQSHHALDHTIYHDVSLYIMIHRPHLTRHRWAVLLATRPTCRSSSPLSPWGRVSNGDCSRSRTTLHRPGHDLVLVDASFARRRSRKIHMFHCAVSPWM